MAANNSKLATYGRKHAKGLTDDWNQFRLDAEVADVKRPLASVCKLCDAGNRVVFDPTGSYTELVKTGNITEMETLETGIGSMCGCRLFKGR